MTQAVAGAAAERAVAMLVELSADLRACAILDGDGALLASSEDAPWAERAADLWEAGEASGSGPATQVHVAADSGEVFAVRDPQSGSAAVAVTDRFALESLMFCDLRAALRELADEG